MKISSDNAFTSSKVMDEVIARISVKSKSSPLIGAVDAKLEERMAMSPWSKSMDRREGESE